jgi:predicted transcriptional regulator
MLWKLPTVEEISSLRRQLSLSQSKLAKLSGISQSALNKFERGQIDLGYSKISRIAEVLMRKLQDQMGTPDLLSNYEAKDIMQDNIVWVNALDKVGDVISLMTKEGFSQIPVKKQDRSVGSVSEKIVISHLDKGTSLDELSDVTVESIMGPPFPTVSCNTVLEAVSIILKHSNAVLVTSDGAIAGIITLADFLKLTKKR